MANLLNTVLRRLRETYRPTETATAIAAKLEVGKVYLSKVERGDLGRPTEEVLEKMLAIYNPPEHIKDATRHLFKAALMGHIQSEAGSVMHLGEDNPMMDFAKAVSKLPTRFIVSRQLMTVMARDLLDELYLDTDQVAVWPVAIKEFIFAFDGYDKSEDDTYRYLFDQLTQRRPRYFLIDDAKLNDDSRLRVFNDATYSCHGDVVVRTYGLPDMFTAQSETLEYFNLAFQDARDYAMPGEDAARLIAAWREYAKGLPDISAQAASWTVERKGSRVFVRPPMDGGQRPAK